MLCAVAGLLSVAWWVVSAFLGLGLVTFLTGSMSPKYPTGSVAVTMPVARKFLRRTSSGVRPTTEAILSMCRSIAKIL